MTSRRRFLTAAAATLAAPSIGSPAARPAIPKHATILFQGDSVTDNFHVRTVAEANHERALGTGYPLLVAARILAKEPGAGYRFFNRGVSGHRVPDLAARWQTDTLDIKPDILSVLVGVNDFWHTLLNGYTGTVESYERDYVQLLENTRTALPGVQLVVMEPFAVAGRHVDERWYPAFPQYQAAARRVAERMHARWVPLQKTFTELSAKYGADKWAWDGVHPTAAGHAVIARAWEKAVL